MPCIRSSAVAAVALALLATVAHATGAAAGRTAADSRAWCPEPEARQFDFWLGEWDVVNRRPGPDGKAWETTGLATDRVYAVVGGCGLVEHWRGYAIPGAGHIVGFSVRAWDPASSEWELVLLWPIGGRVAFGNPSGRFEDGTGHFHNRIVNAAGNPVRTRLSFFDIEGDTFTWGNGVSADDGASWSRNWLMHFERRPRTANGLLHGPAMTTLACPGDGHRALDGQLGEWRGVRVEAGGETTTVRTQLTRILEGCAVMQRTWAEDGSWERFDVLALETESGRWAGYGFSSNRRKLVRYEAGAGGPVDGATGDKASGAAVFTMTEVESQAGTLLRSRWRLEEPGFVRTVEASSAPDGPWRLVAEYRFRDRP